MAEHHRTIVERLERMTSALKVEELAELLAVTPAHLYSLASRGLMPSMRIAGAIRLDPQEIAVWLRSRTVKSYKSSA